MAHNTTILNKLLRKTAEVGGGDNEEEDRKFYIYVQSKWLTDYVDIVMQLTTNDNCFKGKIYVDEMKKSAAELEIAYQDFYDECRRALTADIALPGFQYEVDEGEKVFKLIKTIEFDIVYIELELEEVPNHCELLNTAIELLTAKHRDTMETVETVRKNFLQYQQTLDSLQMCVDERISLEDEMLQKFALVLNSKKEKIAQLEEQLKLRNSDGNVTPTNSSDYEEHNADEEDDANTDIETEAEFTVATQAMTPPPQSDRSENA